MPTPRRRCAFVVWILLTFTQTNIHAQAFTEVASPFINVVAGQAIWGDYDNDGDLDLLIAGHVNPLEATTKIYRNDAGTFVDIQAPINPLTYGTLEWGDYDNDGDLDILLVGEGTFSPISKIFQNNNGLFIDIVAPLITVQSATAAWGDYDNDGDLDVAIAGYHTASDQRVTHLYRNDGSTFVAVEAAVVGVEGGSLSWGDYDNDGDLDLLVTGATLAGNGAYVSAVYRNDAGAFIDIGAEIQAVRGLASWGDYDNDGALDILLTGIKPVPSPPPSSVASVYRNTTSAFTPFATLEGLFSDVILSGDYDNDGDLDILLMGTSMGDRIFHLYRNDGNSFTEVTAPFIPLSVSWGAQGDYDNDGDLDILIIGEAPPSVFLTKLYRNDTATPSSAPTAPTNLTATPQPGAVRLTWNPATDDATPAPGLTYNLRVGTTPGGIDVVAPMADPSTGSRTLVARGNADHGTHRVINNLAPGTYYWSVQAIDHTFLGSPFAGEQSFVLTTPTSVETKDPVPPEHHRLAQNYPNPFRTTTTIEYALAHTGFVSLNVYNLLGEKVASLVAERQDAGLYRVAWDATGMPSGIYSYRLLAGTQSQTKRLVLIR